MTNVRPGDGVTATELSRRNAALVSLVGVFALIALFIASPHLPTPANADLYRAMAYAHIALVTGSAMLVLCGISNLATGPLLRPVAIGICFLAAGVGATALGWNWVSDAGRLIGAGSLGFAASRAIREPHWLPAVCLAVTISDAWSVFAAQGISRQVIENHGEVIPWFTVRVPLPGLPLSQAAQLGTTDLIFAGLFLGTAVRFGLGRVNTSIALSLAVPATFALGIELLGGKAVPALPLMALFTVLAHPRFYTQSVVQAIRPSRPPHHPSPGDDDWEDPWADPLEPPSQQ